MVKDFKGNEIDWSGLAADECPACKGRNSHVTGCPKSGLALKPVDMVNHPPHYTRGPMIPIATPRVIECIEIIRHVRDFRLATAMKYVWRVAFGGKHNDREDIEKAIWYLQDWLANSIEGQ